jgi:hypothetical protein
VHPTLGILARFQAFFYALSFSTSDGVPPLAPARVTQTVETVEKVPFQKLIFEKWEGNTKKRLIFGAPHNILVRFWLFFSLLWEIFMNIFRIRGFSTVSLARPLQNKHLKNPVKRCIFVVETDRR